jgi:aryl-alcohol dehydrogenase-like predicted oxidoreductase
MNKNTRPKKFNKWLWLWNQWDAWLVVNDVTPLQAAISFSISDNRITKVTVGVDSLEQLKEIISASNNNINKFPKEFNIKDSKLLNPSEWSSL